MTRYIRPVSLAVLSLSLFLIGIGGIYGGLVFLADPSGGLMGMSLSYLDGLPIHSYLLPGLWLLTMMGAAPLLILYGLWIRPAWAWTTAIERRSQVSWAWIAGLALCIVLLLQLGVELLLGMIGPPTVVTGALGLVALVCLLLPAVRAWYSLPAIGQAMR
jgi:hypothetical protein